MNNIIRKVGYAVIALVLLFIAFKFLGWVLQVAIVIGLALVAFKVFAPELFARKIQEWRNDAKALWMWVQLAFSRNRDANQTSAMAHQQYFLTGRLMSPVNIFTVAPLIIALIAVVFGLAAGWSRERMKAQRDAPCSERELARGIDGEFLTTRQACAALGATNEAALEWMNEAVRREEHLQTQIDTIRAETDAQLERERGRRARREAVVQQQRRRENEAISSALGVDGAPDLERSLCELTGRSDCGPTGTDGGPAGTTSPGSVPDAAVSPIITANPNSSE